MKIKIPIQRFLFSVLITVAYGVGILKIAPYFFPNLFNHKLIFVFLFLSIVLCLIFFFSTNKILFLGELSKEEAEKEYKIKQKNLGSFEYNQLGFVLKNKNEYLDIKWSEIRQISLINEDNWDVDKLTLLIETEHSFFTISEDEEGWYYFVERLRDSLKIEDIYMHFMISSQRSENIVIWKDDDKE